MRPRVQVRAEPQRQAIGQGLGAPPPDRRGRQDYAVGLRRIGGGKGADGHGPAHGVPQDKDRLARMRQPGGSHAGLQIGGQQPLPRPQAPVRPAAEAPLVIGIGGNARRGEGLAIPFEGRGVVVDPVHCDHHGRGHPVRAPAADGQARAVEADQGVGLEMRAGKGRGRREGFQHQGRAGRQPAPGQTGQHSAAAGEKAHAASAGGWGRRRR